MKIATFQYERGSRQHWTGMRVLAMRFFPMFVTKTEGRRYFDSWFSTLAPSPKLKKAYSSGKLSRAQFVSRYKKEMAQPAARQAIRLLADLSAKTRVSVGCGCHSEDICHRPVLRELIDKEARRK